MKKFLLICIAVLMSFTASAQKNYKTFSWGIKAGANVSSLSGLDNIEAIKSAASAGFTGGVFFEFRPLKFIGITAEGLYAKQGGELKGVTGSWSDMSVSTDLAYIDVPIMAKIYLYKGFSANVGIMPSFLLNSKLSLTDKDAKLLGANKAAFSIPVGISYEFGCGLILDARYKFGLTNVASAKDLVDNAAWDMFAKENIKNQSFSFMVGWRF